MCAQQHGLTVLRGVLADGVHQVVGRVKRELQVVRSKAELWNPKHFSTTPTHRTMSDLQQRPAGTLRGRHGEAVACLKHGGVDGHPAQARQRCTRAIAQQDGLERGVRARGNWLVGWLVGYRVWLEDSSLVVKGVPESTDHKVRVERNVGAVATHRCQGCYLGVAIRKDGRQKMKRTD